MREASRELGCTRALTDLRMQNEDAVAGIGARRLGWTSGDGGGSGEHARTVVVFGAGLPRCGACTGGGGRLTAHMRVTVAVGPRPFARPRRAGARGGFEESR